MVSDTTSSDISDYNFHNAWKPVEIRKSDRLSIKRVFDDNEVLGRRLRFWSPQGYNEFENTIEI